MRAAAYLYELPFRITLAVLDGYPRRNRSVEMREQGADTIRLVRDVAAALRSGARAVHMPATLQPRAPSSLAPP